MIYYVVDFHVNHLVQLDKKKGFDDERSNVFNKIIEILKAKKPKIIILENVKNLKSHDNGNTYKIIKEKLTEAGYYIKSEILDTSKLTGIPQHRERIYIVGFRNKKKYNKFRFEFDNIKKRPISDFLENNIDSKFYYTDKLKVYKMVTENVKKNIDTNTIYQYRRTFVRENKSKCVPTLTANMGGGGHNVPILKDNKGIRKLTPRECFNLQGFDNNYKFPAISNSALYKLAGNAVTVKIVELIVTRINELI